MLGLFANTIIIAQTDSVLNHEGDDDTSMREVTVYKGACGCSNPMSTDDFTKVINNIRLKITDNKMLAQAKQKIRGNCFLANQVEEIMLVFADGITRLNFLEFARDYTYDLDNYYSLLRKYPYFYRSSMEFGQLYNPTQIKEYQTPKSFTNELNRNWISNGRILELQRDFYFRGGRPPE